GHDARQRDRQDEQERDGVSAEEAKAAHRCRRSRPEDERERRREPAGFQRELQRVPGLGVVPGRAEPLRAEARNRPALDVGGVEGVDADEDERNPEEENDERRPQTERQPRGPRLHYSASNAPSRLASVR